MKNSSDKMLGWGEYCDNVILNCVVPGNHFSIMKESVDEIAKGIADT